MGEHLDQISPAAATDEPAVPATHIPAIPLARASGRLTESLIEPALEAGRDARPGRARRSDGWTPERIRAFLTMLAQCGCVEDAARAAGMSARSAYNLRNSAKGAAFRIAWDASCHLARPRIADVAVSRVLHGSVEVIVRDGKVWGERHRHDNRLLMAVLARLDRLVESDNEEDRVARLAAQEYDAFLDIACAGGEGAAEFIAERNGEGYAYRTGTTAANLERLAEYRCSGAAEEEEANAADDDAGDGEPEAGVAELALPPGLAERLDEVVDDEDMPFPCTRRTILEAAMKLDPERTKRQLAAWAAEAPPPGDAPPLQADAPEGSEPLRAEDPAASEDSDPPASKPAAPRPAESSSAGEPASIQKPAAGVKAPPAPHAADAAAGGATAANAMGSSLEPDGPPPPGWVAPGR